MARIIEKIPATKKKYSLAPLNSFSMRRVAAYARVSTGSEEQLNSYRTQKEHYDRYIRSRPDWEYCGIYADEGITGVNTKKREAFKRMIQDAYDKKIDLIVTKSVSRFARNTVDAIDTVRKLRAIGVEVYFENQNIWTFDTNSDFALSVFASQAQEESRNISDNVQWTSRHRFERGEYSLAYSTFLGYEKGEDGKLKIVESQAKIVRLIYDMFVGGKSPSFIARHLTAEGIPTPAGKQTWRSHTVESILKNEKYKGSVQLQKKFTVDFLEKKMKVNEGEIPSYYIEDDHPAIVSKELYGLAQLEFQMRKEQKKNRHAGSCFSGRIFCGQCGGMYGSKVWHSNDKYRRKLWQCNDKFKGEKCATPNLEDGQLKAAFMAVFNGLLADKSVLAARLSAKVAELKNTAEIDAEIKKAQEQLEKSDNEIFEYIALNSKMAIPQHEYARKFNRLKDRSEKLEKRIDELKTDKSRRYSEQLLAGSLLSKLNENTEPITEFDETLFCILVRQINVYKDKLVFYLKEGMTIEYML